MITAEYRSYPSASRIETGPKWIREYFAGRCIVDSNAGQILVP